MRNSICAQSCDSVPPAPGWIDTSAPSRSYSPDSRLFELEVTDLLDERVELARQVTEHGVVALGLREVEHLPESLKLRSGELHSSTVRLARFSSATVRCASSGRSQNPGTPMRGFELRGARAAGVHVKDTSATRRAPDELRRSACAALRRSARVFLTRLLRALRVFGSSSTARRRVRAPPPHPRSAA